MNRNVKWQFVPIGSKCKRLNLIGIILTFTDDLLKAGTNEFERNVISPLKTTFTFAPENEEMFTYIGIDITQNGTISINQNNYTQTLKCIPLSSLRRSQQHDSITEIERKLFRAAIGQLNWIAGVSRPEISFHVSVASLKIKTATVADLISIHKVRVAQHSTTLHTNLLLV